MMDAVSQADLDGDIEAFAKVVRTRRSVRFRRHGLQLPIGTERA
jgi:hypothetical protein